MENFPTATSAIAANAIEYQSILFVSYAREALAQILEARAEHILNETACDYQEILDLVWVDLVRRQSETKQIIEKFEQSLTCFITKRGLVVASDPSPTIQIVDCSEETNCHFSPPLRKIVLSFDLDYFPAALLNRVAMRLNEDVSTHEFEDWMATFLLHEYTHLEQTLRSTKYHADLTYVTLGRGKRGGFHRDFATTETIFQYRAERGEIGAFAMAAAWEIWKSPTKSFADSRVVCDYNALLALAKSGEIESLNVRQFERAWRRFIKKTVIALNILSSFAFH